MLSGEKTTHLTHVILKELLEKDIVTPLAEESNIRREIKQTILRELKIYTDIDTLAQNKISSFSKKIPEGSPEWEVLYRKFFHEEAAKKGRI